MILIFILTVLVSGSILTYLSINNISNFKELTEKKISEEQRTLVEEYSRNFQKHLEQLTKQVVAEIQNNSITNIHKIRSIDTIQGINTPILIDSSGNYLWPHYSRITNTLNNRLSSKVYHNNLKKGEQSEFVHKNFQTSRSRYLESLKASKNSLDSVHIYNAMARLYIKMEQPEKAFELYTIVISKYPDIYNEYGFLYANYAISQLLKLSDATHSAQVQKLLLNYLKSLIDGKVTSNKYTLEMITTISEWLSLEDTVKVNSSIDQLLPALSNTLKVMSRYQEVIDKKLNNDTTIETLELTNDFLVLKPFEGTPNELFVFSKSIPFFLGFVIDLGEIFNTVVYKVKNNLKTEFQYKIAYEPKEVNGYFLNSNLTTLNEFSPYFEDYVLHISLKDSKIVNEVVFNRKITYGIGLFLLLGAMIMSLVIFIRDVKREHRIKKLRADFVSNVTHELKTPLTSIYMFAESIVLGRVKSEKDLHKYANIIVKESEKLKRMITNILDFSRKESDQLVYTLKKENLSIIVKTTIDEMNYWLEISDFDVKVDLQKEVYALVEVDGLKQAISNLISNAIKYSTSNKQLLVRLFKKENRAFIEIEDRGIGIPKDKLKLIFNKFYRVNSVENESASGTGLGLTVTKDIIEAQKGNLLVESTLGMGSKFTITFNL